MFKSSKNVNSAQAYLHFLRQVARVNSWKDSVCSEADGSIHFEAASENEIVNHNQTGYGPVVFTLVDVLLKLRVLRPSIYVVSNFTVTQAVPGQFEDMSAIYYLAWYSKSLPSIKDLSNLDKKKSEYWIVDRPMDLKSLFDGYDYYSRMNGQLPVFNLPKL